MTDSVVHDPPEEWRPYHPGMRWRRPHLGIKAEGFRMGHRMGRTDACRRLWPHLTDAGRNLATAIALEGEEERDSPDYAELGRQIAVSGKYGGAND